MLLCGWSAGSRFWWQHNVFVVKVFDFKWWFAIRQIGSGPAIFRIMLKGCRFFICLHCKHIKNYCLIPRGNRTAGFIRPAVSSVRAISIRWFCIPYLRPHAGRGVRSTPVLVLSPVKIANAIFTAPRGGMGISASLLRSIFSFNLRLRAGLRPLPTAVRISCDSLH